MPERQFATRWRDLSRLSIKLTPPVTRPLTFPSPSPNSIHRRSITHHETEKTTHRFFRFPTKRGVRFESKSIRHYASYRNHESSPFATRTTTRKRRRRRKRRRTNTSNAVHRPRERNELRERVRKRKQEKEGAGGSGGGGQKRIHDFA